MRKKFTLVMAAAAVALCGAAMIPLGAKKNISKKCELKMPLGLDAQLQYVPEDNPLTAEKMELGRMLYFDKRLSADNSVACASCHNPQFGFTDGAAVSTGINGQQGGRSAPTVINRLFSDAQFWDGRAASLEEQALGPIQNPIEMGNTLEAVVKKLNAIKGYRTAFQKAFGTEVTSEGIRKAFASFERTVLSGNSPYDRYKAGEHNALSASAQRGLALFESVQNADVARRCSHRALHARRQPQDLARGDRLLRQGRSAQRASQQRHETAQALGAGESRFGGILGKLDGRAARHRSAEVAELRAKGEG